VSVARLHHVTTGLPIGVVIRTIEADPVFWLESARRLDEAGYAGVWAWDHLMGPPPGRPTVEAWTILSMAAASTRQVTIGTFVLNVMNRHPALVARMASTLQIASGGRFILGLGIGAETGEHSAYGIELPEISVRVKRLAEAVAAIRALWTGGPVTRELAYYPLRAAVALPAPDPTPRIVIAGETPPGARRAARIGDGWTASDTNFEALLPEYLEMLHRSGRRREDQLVLVEANEGDWLSDTSLEASPWVNAPRTTWARWSDAGADGAVILARSRADIDALVDAIERW
jgi:alkanesulfonate monooxygenase SsuD/methylene tetrahydromethanopterin reductase-like flavin-dependent oxidoreductase (luciferase family)